MKISVLKKKRNSFEDVHSDFINEIKNVKNFKSLKKVYTSYFDKFKKLEVSKPEDCMKVGIVGELYTLMEPFSNYFLEKELAKNRIQVSRYINVTFLLFEKPRMRKKDCGAGSI